MKNEVLRPSKKPRLFRIVSWFLMVLLLVSLTGCTIMMKLSGGETLTYQVSEPLGDIKMANFDIYAGSGNLTIDSLSGSDLQLASGTLQYMEKLGPPTKVLNSKSGQADLALKWGENAAPCSGAIEWAIHLNPGVASALVARSGGGNITLNLTGMAVTNVATETGGGNVEVVLPGDAGHLSVTAGSGGGNVVVSIPAGTAAHIHATTGLGKVIIDPRFIQVDSESYQSADYDTAASKVDLKLGSGAGNIEVKSY